MGKFFGTDGIRGIAYETLTYDLAVKAGIAAARVLTKSCGHTPKILIGKDTRASCNMLEEALLFGFKSCQAQGISLGIVPTPAVSFLIKKYGADAGVMISASHNSFEFNGIKFFDKNGYKLSDQTEEEIESVILKLSETNFNMPDGNTAEKVSEYENACNDYIDYLAKTVTFSSGNNIKILVDCANGASSFTAKKLFSKLHINAHIIHDAPNGTNINENCGSTHIDKLSKLVKEEKYDLGVAFDGDADRCLAVDEKGDIMDGDSILAICAHNLKLKNELTNNTVVGTIMSNMGLKKFCSNQNINFEETQVGDRYVLEKMIDKNYSLGGEQSGHVIFKKHSSTGDGQLTALQLLEILLKSNKTASFLNSQTEKFPQKSLAIKINANQKGMLQTNEHIEKYIQEIYGKLAGNGRVVIRESGTEPKIRIMAEHKNEQILNEIIDDAAKFIKNQLDV